MYSATVGLVKATWHTEAVDAFAISCSSELKSANPQIQVNTYSVPGVVEIPLFTKKLIQSQTVDIVVVAGLIADHGVYRHDFVASTVMGRNYEGADGNWRANHLWHPHPPGIHE